MKKQALTMIALAILVGSLAASAKAQSLSSGKLVANIPFTFSAGSQTLPAGDYVVRCTNPASDQTILQLRSKDGRYSVMLQMTSTHGKASDSSKVVFHRYGARYFFAQAWVSGEVDGLEALESRAERNVSHELAGIKPQSKTIALVRSR